MRMERSPASWRSYFNALFPTITVSSFIVDVSKLHGYTFEIEDVRLKCQLIGFTITRIREEIRERRDVTFTIVRMKW